MRLALTALLLLASACASAAGAGGGPPVTTPVKDDAVVAGSGRPIILVGNALTGVLSWSEHAEKLVGRRRVARVQPRNVSVALARGALPAGYSVKSESAALGATLDDFGWREPLDLVGWSWGGLIALDYALDHPERVRTLVLAEPNAPWLLSPSMRADPAVVVAEQRATKLAGGVSDDDLADFMRETLGPNAEPKAHPRWSIWRDHKDALQALPAAFAHRDDPARLARLTMPILLVRGEGSARYSTLIAEALAERLPQAHHVELPGGHMAPVASMARFLDEVERFQAKPLPKRRGR